MTVACTDTTDLTYFDQEEVGLVGSMQTTISFPFSILFFKIDGHC
jgi:hypothetical protein